MHIGAVTGIWRYPVKSLRGERLVEVTVLADGLDGDRQRALLVREGHARIDKPYRGKENERLHMTPDPGDAIRIARERGVELVVDDEQERYFDDAPVSVIVDRWLDELRAHVGYEVEAERFRPNFIVGSTNGFASLENELLGGELTIGYVRLRVRDTIRRCVTPTYGLHGGPSDPEILRFVANERANVMGVHCDVLRAGVVRTGDSVDFASP
jgi:uncharacterized protein